MSGLSRRVRIAVWLVVPLVLACFGLFVGAVTGMLIGDALGHPEGEGFIGFLYGLWIGGAAGLGIGLALAWGVDRRSRAGSGGGSDSLSG